MPSSKSKSAAKAAKKAAKKAIKKAEKAEAKMRQQVAEAATPTKAPASEPEPAEETAEVPESNTAATTTTSASSNSSPSSSPTAAGDKKKKRKTGPKKKSSKKAKSSKKQESGDSAQAADDASSSAAAVVTVSATPVEPPRRSGRRQRTSVKAKVTPASPTQTAARTTVTAVVAPAKRRGEGADGDRTAAAPAPATSKKRGGRKGAAAKRGADAISDEGRVKNDTPASQPAPTGRKWTQEYIPNQRTGRWGKAESKALMEALHTEAALAGIDPQDMCGNLAQLKSKSRTVTDGPSASDIKQIWHSIAKAVPERSMRSCYYHAEAILKRQSGKTGPWTLEEKTRLVNFVNEHGKRWTKVGELLGRYAGACKDTYRRIQLKAKHKEIEADDARKGRGAWSKEENELLTKLVKLHNSDPDYKAKKIEYPDKNIHWRSIAKIMGTRDEYQCCNTWNQRLHSKLIKSQWTGEKDLELIRHIQQLGLKDVSEIPWASLPFKQTPAILRRRFRQAFRATETPELATSAIDADDTAQSSFAARLAACAAALLAQIEAKKTEAAELAARTRGKSAGGDRKRAKKDNGSAGIPTVAATPAAQAHAQSAPAGSVRATVVAVIPATQEAP